MNLFRKHNSQNDAKLLENVGKCSFSLQFSRKNIIHVHFFKIIEKCATRCGDTKTIELLTVCVFHRRKLLDDYGSHPIKHII